MFSFSTVNIQYLYCIFMTSDFEETQLFCKKNILGSFLS